MSAAESPQRSCFGTFLGTDECKRCAASKLCKSVLISNGFDLVASMVEELAASLPEGQYAVPDDDPRALAQVLVDGSPIATPTPAEVQEHG